MSIFRVSTLALMAVTLLFALGFAALRSGSELWFSAVYTLTVALLLVAVVAARYRRGDEAAFWFGFAVFGWGYFLLGLGPWTNTDSSLSESIGGSFNENLLTSKLILFLVARLRTATNDLEAIDKITANTIGISHLLVTLVLALLGGVIAILVRRRRRKGRATDTSRLGRPVTAVILVGLTLVAALSSASLFARAPVPYFADGASKGPDGLSDFTVAWYSKHLAAMNEPSLCLLARTDPDATVYRLLWLPSFDHPVCVRINLSGVARVHASVLDGKGGYAPGQVAIVKDFILDGAQRMTLMSHLEKADFWNMPTVLEQDRGSDGDQLVVEGVKGGKYHIVDRWEPDPAYEELCHFMLALTEIKPWKTWEGYHGSPESSPPGK
jgi:hypothetical protein